MGISLVATASIDGGSGNPSITHGLTIKGGDVILAGVHANLAANTVADNNGSTPFAFDDFGDNPDSARLYLFNRVCNGNEPSAFAFTLGSSARWSLLLRQYRGVDRAVWDVAPSASTRATGDSGTGLAVASAISILTPGACGVVWVADDFAPTTTVFNTVNNSYGNLVNESGQQCQASADKLGLSTGTTGTTTISTSGGTRATYVVYQVALKPAMAPPIEDRRVRFQPLLVR